MSDDSRSPTSSGLEYDRSADAYRLFHRTDADPPLSRRILRAIAALDDGDPLSWKPMYYAVDVELLDRFLDGEERGLEGELAFGYRDYEITVRSEGEVLISPAGPDASSSDA